MRGTKIVEEKQISPPQKLGRNFFHQHWCWPLDSKPLKVWETNLKSMYKFCRPMEFTPKFCWNSISHPKMTFSCSKSIFINFDKYESMGKPWEITKKGWVMTSKKSFKKTECVHRKPGARLRWPTVRLTLAGRKPGCYADYPGFFINALKK
jgi:hypothetical protein